MRVDDRTCKRRLQSLPPQGAAARGIVSANRRVGVCKASSTFVETSYLPAKSAFKTLASEIFITVVHYPFG